MVLIVDIIYHVCDDTAAATRGQTAAACKLFKYTLIHTVCISRYVKVLAFNLNTKLICKIVCSEIRLQCREYEYF